MESNRVARARWRWRGAWQWLTFVVAALADGIIAVVRPFVKQSYCVIVKPRLPLDRSVVFTGYEPNWLFAEGVN